jgi:hypothetical protein
LLNTISNNDFYPSSGARSCDWDQFDRPVGGIVDFCYPAFKLNERGEGSEKVTRELIEIAIHEIGHVLGLTSNDMAFYYDKETGFARTPRPIKPASDTMCFNGKNASEFENDIYTPSTNLELCIPESAIMRMSHLQLYTLL